MVSQRKPNDGLYQELKKHMKSAGQGLLFSLRRVGDCEAPAIIAAAVYAGHRYARELDTSVDTDNPLRHDRVFAVS